MNAFGKSLVIEDDYKKPKVNLFFEVNKVIGGRPAEEGLLVPVFQWLSNTRENISTMQKINEKFFFVNKSILMRQVVLNYRKVPGFPKYPKAKKEEHKQEWLLPFIQKYFDWSCSDLKFNLEFLSLDDPELHKELAVHFGFDKKQCRKLGLKLTAPKLEKSKLNQINK